MLTFSLKIVFTSCAVSDRDQKPMKPAQFIGRGRGRGQGRGRGTPQKQQAVQSTPHGEKKTSSTTRTVGRVNQPKPDSSTPSKPGGLSERQPTSTPTPPVGMTTGPVGAHKAAPSSTQTKASPQTAPADAPRQSTGKWT